MLNVNDLELRHRKYKLKSYIPYFAIFISLTVISIVGVVMFTYTNEPKRVEASNNLQDITKESSITKASTLKKTDESEKKRDTASNPDEIAKSDLKKEISHVKKPQEHIEQPKMERTILAPSLNFIQNIGADPQQKYEVVDGGTFENKEPAKVEDKKPDAIKKQQEDKEEEKSVVKIEKKESINIERKDDYSDIQDVIKRFQKNNNPALSLFVAKKYYQLEEYDKAYNYALVTNEINNNIEDSWLIFARSLVKLNKKEMAIETLKKYVNHSGSSQAKILLDEIVSGKFK